MTRRQPADEWDPLPEDDDELELELARGTDASSATDADRANSGRVIELFADVVCPFTHVGLRRLVDRRDALGQIGTRLHVRAWPLEIVNGVPLDAAHVTETVRALRKQVAPTLFKGFERGPFPSSSLPALSLAAAGYRASMETGEAVSLALRTALFEHGRDISDDGVLEGIARQHRISTSEADCATVGLDLAEGRRRRVIGSPHFFVGDDDWFCPALAVGRDEEGRLEVMPRPDEFERFVSSCFGDSTSSE